MRFLGTSPKTSNIIETIQSIMYQLIRLFDIKFNNEQLKYIENYRDLRYEFRQILSSLESKAEFQPILIFLDSIDQLNSKDFNLDWFLSSLPKNIKFVYSTLTDHENILKAIKTKHCLLDKNFLEVESLNFKNSMQIMKIWLEDHHKNYQVLLNSTFLIKLFQNAQLFPLYVKLIYDIVTITSKFELNENDLSECLTIDTCINYLFHLISKSHEKVVFNNCMFYITIFKDGISQLELEDILSLDDDVLIEIFKRHETKTTRFPSFLWVRIKKDLKEYLCEKQIDGIHVISWYHRKFRECARKLYVDSLTNKEQDRLLMNIIHFYLETWSSIPKPYCHSENVIRKYNLKSSYKLAIRNPGITTNPDTGIFYSQRKLKQLPFFIFMLNDKFLKINALKNFIYFNYDFMYAQFKAKDVQFFVDCTNDLWSYYENFSNLKNPLSNLVFLNNIYVQNLRLLQAKPNLLAIVLKSTLANKFNNYEINNVLQKFDSLSVLRKHSILLGPNYCYIPILSNFNSKTVFYSHTSIRNLIMCQKTPLLFIISEYLTMINTQNYKILDEMSLTALDIDVFKSTKIILKHEPSIDKINELKFSDLDGHLLIYGLNRIFKISFKTGELKTCKKFFDERIIFARCVSPKHLLLKINNRAKNIKYYYFRI